MSTIPAVDTRSSSEAAFAELYERNVDRIFGFCRRRLRSRQEAEDAVQETFVSAMRAIQRGSVPVCESAWLFKIAENVCFAAYRSGARRNARDLSDSERIGFLAAPEGSTDSLFGLQEALDTLPDRQRRAFVLRELRGLSYKEIAVQLGVSVASVETLIYRAKRGLAHALEAGAGLRGGVTASMNLGSIVASVKGWAAGAATVKIASAAGIAALATAAVGDAPRHVRQTPVASAAHPSATIHAPDLRAVAGGPAGRAGRPTTATTPLRPGPTKPRPRPELRRPQPLDIPPTPAVTNSVPAETLVVRPTTDPQVSPVPPPPVSAPQAPEPLPAVPALPNVPTPGELLPEIPPLPEAPPLPEVPLLPEVPKLP